MQTEKIVTTELNNTLHLCLLINEQSQRAIKISLSFLRQYPTIRVTLIQQASDQSEDFHKDYIKNYYGNKVDVIKGDDPSKFGGDFDPHDTLSYFLFLPAGDWLSDDALDKIAGVAKDTQPDIIYTDQDLINENGHLCEPQFKPDAAQEYFLHCDYIGAFFCIKKSTLADLGGIDLLRYDSERYRLLLHIFLSNGRIEHLAQPVYHAQQHSDRTSTSKNVVPLLTQYFDSKGNHVEVKQKEINVYRLKREIRGDPKVSIIIPFRDKPDLLRQCLQAVLSKTQYSNYEVIGVSNRSQSLTIYELMSEFSQLDSRIRFVEHNIPFNFSALVNYGVSVAAGEFIVLMNNDVTVINSGWLSAMLEHGQRQEIGVVGAKLIYPHGTIQHAGLSIQQSGYIAHLHKNYPADAKGYMNRLISVQNVSAVTGALCLFKITLHQQLRGFDENRFKIAFNDVDFCLRAEAKGYLNIFTPYARAYHHESLSRGYETTADRKRRFDQEKNNFGMLYAPKFSRSDPYYNPNLNQNRDDFSY